MAHRALIESDCIGILQAFRLAGLGVPEPLLEHLAYNFALDAIVDIHPSDIIEILSQPGGHRILSRRVTKGPAVAALVTLSKASGQRHSDFSCAKGALLIVKSVGSCSMTVFGQLLAGLQSLLPPAAVWGYAWYEDPAMTSGVEVSIILTGLNERPFEACAKSHARDSQACG